MFKNNCCKCSFVVLYLLLYWKKFCISFSVTNYSITKRKFKKKIVSDILETILILILSDLFPMLFLCNQDRASQLTMRVLLSFKSSEVEGAVKSLNEQQLDILMKYIYKGFENPTTDGSSAQLLTWHEKVAIRVRNLKFATYLKFATCENTNKINELW